MVARVLLALLACGGATAAYPSTYPFENEAFVPVDLLPATPDWSYSDTDDPGGYMYYHLATLQSKKGDIGGSISMDFDGTLTEAHIPFAFILTGHIQFMMIIFFAAPAAGGWPWEIGSWNCTYIMNGQKYDGTEFTGLVNGEAVCNPGSCCSSYVGVPMYAEDQADWHAYFEERASLGFCPLPEEEVYCALTNGWIQTNCIEAYPAEGVRNVIMPCYDNMVLFGLGCPVYKTAYAELFPFEPTNYRAASSPEQNSALDAMGVHPDRLCHPYSYYHASSGSSAASDTETESSPASKVGYVATLVLSIAFF